MQHYQWMFESWVSSHGVWTQYVIWLFVLAVIVAIWIKIIKWALIGSCVVIGTIGGLIYHFFKKS